MAKVNLSLGSNINPHDTLASAIHRLGTLFPGISLSPVYRSPALGFDGPDFLNLAASFETGRSLGSLQALLSGLEAEHGRKREAPRFSNRSLDIDILTFGDLLGFHDGLQLPRAEITRYAFVLKPLCDICPEERHPENGFTYRKLWSSFPHKEAQPLWPECPIEPRPIQPSSS